MSNISSAVLSTLEEIQNEMFTRAKSTQDERLIKVTDWAEVVPTLDAKNILVLPWCEEEQCEDDIKERSKSQYVYLFSYTTFIKLRGYQETIANGVGQTRERPRMSRLLRQVLNPSVSPMTRTDSDLSPRVKTRSVFSAEPRQRDGPFSEGVSQSAIHTMLHELG